MKVIVSAILLASALSVGAHAQKRDAQNPCADAQTQAELNVCADKQYKAADAELNRVYKQLVAKLEGGALDKFKSAEISWLRYRDDNCAYETALYEGGSMRPMVYSFCLERMTKARTAELRDQLKELDQ